MADIIPIRTPIQLASLELYHKFGGKFWFAGVKIVKDKIMIYYKKGKNHREWIGIDDTYKTFKYEFAEEPEAFSIDFRLKK